MRQTRGVKPMKNTQMTNKELREAIESTSARLATDRSPFGIQSTLPEEVAERLSAHLEHLLSVEAARASVVEIDDAGQPPARK